MGLLCAKTLKWGNAESFQTDLVGAFQAWLHKLCDLSSASEMQHSNSENDSFLRINSAERSAIIQCSCFQAFLVFYGCWTLALKEMLRPHFQMFGTISCSVDEMSFFGFSTQPFSVHSSWFKGMELTSLPPASSNALSFEKESHFLQHCDFLVYYGNFLSQNVVRIDQKFILKSESNPTPWFLVCLYWNKPQRVDGVLLI